MLYSLTFSATTEILCSASVWRSFFCGLCLWQNLITGDGVTWFSHDAQVVHDEVSVLYANTSKRKKRIWMLTIAFKMHKHHKHHRFLQLKILCTEPILVNSETVCRYFLAWYHEMVIISGCWILKFWNYLNTSAVYSCVSAAHRPVTIFEIAFFVLNCRYLGA